MTLVAVLLVHQPQPLLSTLQSQSVWVLEDWPSETHRGQSVTLLLAESRHNKPAFQLVEKHGDHVGGGLQVVHDHLQDETLPTGQLQFVQLSPVNFPAIKKSQSQSG